MKYKLFLFAGLAFLLASCKDEHDHSEHESHEEHKIQFVQYSNEFELFAEADPFVIGETSNILSHFSNLPSFKALESGIITIRLVVNGNEINQILNEPTRKGIYSFDIKPDTKGEGELIFEIKTTKGEFQLKVPEIIVFENEEQADEYAEKAEFSKTNTVVFTKEQSWKIDFATELPKEEPFGQVVKATAQVQSSQDDEVLVVAKTNGIINFSSKEILEGEEVASGETLLTISGSNLSENNSVTRYNEAKTNYELKKADYERAKELAKDKIVSEKELQNAKTEYENSKAVFENLSKNFNTTGQNIISPMTGFVKQLMVKNGQYVESGEPILSISKNKTLLLKAEVQQKFASILPFISSANILSSYNNHVYTLEQLNGKVVSYGKSTNPDNFMIPVNFEIENKGDFFAGEFVELKIKTITDKNSLTIPTTAIMEEQGNYFVFVQITPELFEKREVKIGGNDGLKTEILYGLTSQERIITVGAVLVKLAQATGALDAHSGHVH